MSEIRKWTARQIRQLRLQATDVETFDLGRGLLPTQLRRLDLISQ